LTETQNIPDSFPTVPRPLTARVRRRSWAEAPVRTWMVLTLLIAASLGYLAITNILEGLSERRVIYNGVIASATIVEVNGDSDPRKAIATNGAVGDRTVKLKYRDASGKEIESERELQTSRHKGRHPRDILQIRYDPDKPEAWTDSTEPRPWFARLAIVWMLLPALLLAGIMMLIRRMQILRVWIEGVPMTGTVIDTRQSPIAPRSRVVRFTLDDDRRIFSTFVPISAGDVSRGGELMMLASPTDHSRAIVADLYQEVLNH
jgi:hypothetical protein